MSFAAGPSPVALGRIAEIQSMLTRFQRPAIRSASASAFDAALDKASASPSPAPRSASSSLSVGAAATGARVDWSTGGDALPPGTPYAAEFQAAGARYGISPRLLASVAQVESSFRADAVSGAGAQGLMQFMPATAASYGVDPWNPASAIDGAARFLTDQIRRFGSVDLALAAYNAGPGAVARAGGVPAPTRDYVERVLSTMNGGAA